MQYLAVVQVPAVLVPFCISIWLRIQNKNKVASFTCLRKRGQTGGSVPSNYFTEIYRSAFFGIYKTEEHEISLCTVSSDLFSQSNPMSHLLSSTLISTKTRQFVGICRCISILSILVPLHWRKQNWFCIFTQKLLLLKWGYGEKEQLKKKNLKQTQTKPTKQKNLNKNSTTKPNNNKNNKIKNPTNNTINGKEH